MTVIGPWDPRMTYPTGSHVLHAGRAWVARRNTCGEKPGDGVGFTWLMLVDPATSGTPKADLAESLDNRIGRGA